MTLPESFLHQSALDESYVTQAESEWHYSALSESNITFFLGVHSLLGGLVHIETVTHTSSCYHLQADQGITLFLF